MALAIAGQGRTAENRKGSNGLYGGKNNNDVDGYEKGMIANIISPDKTGRKPSSPQTQQQSVGASSNITDRINSM